jgi:hypothetical protein
MGFDRRISPSRVWTISVKHTAKAGRPDIDAFEAMMARFFKQTGKVIVLLTVRQIFANKSRVGWRRAPVAPAPEG